MGFEPIAVNSVERIDRVSVKVDGMTPDQIRRVNRTLATYELSEFWRALQTFRHCYQGILAIQTMLLSP